MPKVFMAFVLVGFMSVANAQTYTVTVHLVQEDGFTDAPERGHIDGLAASYSAGAQVSLTAVAENGYEFDHWEDFDMNNLGTNNQYQFNITGNTELWAIFKPVQIRHMVTVLFSPVGADSVCSVIGAGQKNDGESFTLTADDNNQYYSFSHWAIGGVSTGITDIVYHVYNIQEDLTITAVFDYIPQQRTISVASNDPTHGSVTLKNSSSETGSSFNIYERDTLTLIATELDPTNYTFTGWFLGDVLVSTNLTYGFRLPEGSGNNTYTAHFENANNTYTMTAHANPAAGAASISPNPTSSPRVNTSFTFSTTAAAGYDFLGWYDENDHQLTTELSYTVNPVMRDRTLTAKFRHEPWTVTANVNPTGAGSVSPASTTVEDGGSITLTATANGHYYFTGWSGTGLSGNTNPYPINNVRRNYTDIVANFVATHTITLTNATLSYTNTTAHAGRYEHGTFYRVTPNERSGYVFSHWSIDGVEDPANTANPYEGTLNDDVTIEAMYKPLYNVTLIYTPGEATGVTFTGAGQHVEGEAFDIEVNYDHAAYTFEKWINTTTSADVSTDNPYHVDAISAHMNLTAVLQRMAQYFDVTIEQEGTGLVSSSLPICPGLNQNVLENRTVTFDAEGTGDWTFQKWVITTSAGTVERTDTHLEWVVTSNTTVKAVFREQGNVTVTIVKHPNNTVGEVSPIDNIGEWPAGTPLTLTASVTNTNYQFWGWIIDGAPMGAMGQTNLTFTPTANVTVHAWFYAPAIDGNVDYLEYNTDSTIVTGVKEDYRRRVTSISIPVLHNGAVQEIAPAAFQGCTSLETLNLVPTVTTIGDYAFAGCTSLANIDVSNVTSFGSDAFYGCTALQGVTLSNSLTAIPNEMFYNCSSLQSINIPATVQTIGNSAFYGCRNLYSVELPAALTTVGNQAFMGNSNLRVVTINGGVTSFGTDCFRSSSNIAQVNFNGTIDQWMNIEFANMLANPAARSHSLAVNGNLLTNLVIPSGVTTVHAFAFYQNTNIESITIPATVTTIDSAAFGRMSSLRRIVLEGDPSAIAVDEDAFINVTKDNVVVEVPCAYTATTNWNGFTNIVGAGVPVLTLVQRVGGTVAITSTPDCGSTEYTYHITAQATAGIYQFVSWSDGAMSPDRDITITEDMTLSAIFNRSYATEPVTDKTYSFEAGNAALEWFNIGEGDNEWVVGDAVAHTSYGTHSLYVTKDDGANCNYNLGSEPYVYTEMKLHDGVYRFSFNYLINDIEDHNVTIALIPIEDGEADDAYMHLAPHAGAYPLVIDELNGNGAWKDAYRLFEIPAEKWYRLAIFWNLNSDDTPAAVAAALDNLTFNWMTPKPSELNNLTATVSVATDDAAMGKAYTWTGDESHLTMGSMTIPVTQEAVHANTLFNLFTINDEVWIHALPETGYRFVRWNDGNTDQDRQLNFFSVYGNAPHYTAYFEPIPVDWTITVLLENGAEEAGVPASGEYGVVYKVGEATISGHTYDVTEVRQIASVDDNPTSQATLVVNQPLAEWAFMGWADENGDTISRENPYTITYGDWNRDVVITALMSKRVECSNDDDYSYYSRPYAADTASNRWMPELRDAIVSNIKVSVENDQIVVENTGDYTVTLYDVAGRALESRISPDQKIYFSVPLSGSYLVRVGNVMTQRVVVVR